MSNNITIYLENTYKYMNADNLHLKKTIINIF
jgi:hypothetical protein